jgi:hypothetical protein
VTTNGSSGHEPVEVTLYVDNSAHGLKKGDHSYNLSQTLQAAVDAAVDDDDHDWGAGPHTVTVQLGVIFTKVNPGDIGAYKVTITD